MFGEKINWKEVGIVFGFLWGCVMSEWLIDWNIDFFCLILSVYVVLVIEYVLRMVYVLII